MLALGFYDAPVQRENSPGKAVIVFANIDNMVAIQKFSASAFTEAVLEVSAWRAARRGSTSLLV